MGLGPLWKYSSTQGFSELQIPLASSLSPVIWKSFWSSYCLPKVNFFTWLLMHKRVLKGENLSKHGFHRPFWCFLCNDVIETSDHIFIDCAFSQLVWELVLNGLSASAPFQISAVSLFASWLDRIPFWQDRLPDPNAKKYVWKNMWHKSILKCIFWKLWTTRNDLIFNCVSSSP